jgi:hypothetical protein
MNDPTKKRFQVLMLVRVSAEIDATDQADAERRSELLAVHGAIPLSLRDGHAPVGSPAVFLSGTVDDVEVADVEECE